MSRDLSLSTKLSELTIGDLLWFLVIWIGLMLAFVLIVRGIKLMRGNRP